MKLYKKMNGLLLTGLLAVSIVSPVCAQVQEKKETPTIEQGVFAQAKQLCIKTKDTVLGASKVVQGVTSVAAVAVCAYLMRGTKQGGSDDDDDNLPPLVNVHEIEQRRRDAVNWVRSSHKNENNRPSQEQIADMD
ncbi:MAG: hypothetical protein NT124_01640 [Candidatus Dependentiae bacterium]|nr:hypothetical protein [Candidatus Dependentiae bacterium]